MYVDSSKIASYSGQFSISLFDEEVYSPVHVLLVVEPRLVSPGPG